ncbi:MAG: HK97 gp10 family phage protein [Epibacterium sp.]|nr:HK97 gp10 family phage protein [Epibacterium sp.]NQX73872.1 HK97 gp10 family phage protein [Epibacterium sp.]
MRVSLEGQAALRRSLEQIGDEAREGVSKAVLGTAVEIRKRAVRSIHRGPKTGTVYQKYNPRRVHQASAPGEAPATDTKRLANSIFFDREGVLTATVGSRLVYAKYLEYGTRDIAQRPFMTPAAEAERVKLYKRVERAVAEALS